MITRSLRRHYDDGKNKVLFGNRTLTLTDEEIIYLTEIGESKTKWSAIEKFCETEQYLYLYHSAFTAFIIPVKAFANDEEKNEFILNIKERPEI